MATRVFQKKKDEKEEMKRRVEKNSERFSDLIYQGKVVSDSENNVTYIEKWREVFTYGLRHRTLSPGFSSSFHIFTESKQEAKRQRKSEITGAYWHQYLQ